jgi:hypothetical protein
MKRIELELDEETLERARQLAAARQCSLEELIKDLLKQTEAHKPLQDPYLGMLADEPELIDRVTEISDGSPRRASSENTLWINLYSTQISSLKFLRESIPM